MKSIILSAMFMLSSTVSADTKWIGGIHYGNVCRSGNVYSVRFGKQYYKPVGYSCELLTNEGYFYGRGLISYE
jgi:hypothetical protein